MSIVTKSIIMNAPIEQVFMYYARPEHIAGHFPEEAKKKAGDYRPPAFLFPLF